MTYTVSSGTLNCTIGLPYTISSSLHLFLIFKIWWPITISDFRNFAIFVKNLLLSPFVRWHAKFGDDRTIHGRLVELLRICDFQNGGRLPSWIWYDRDVIADHPRLVFDGRNILLKLHVDHVYTLHDIAIFIFYPFGLKLPHFGEFCGILPPNDFRYCRNPQRTDLGRRHVVWAINNTNPPTGSIWARAREKIRYNQPSRQKVTKT